MQEFLFKCKKVLDAVSALAVQWIVPSSVLANAREIIVYVTFGAGTSAGEFTVEEAPTDDYGGTWVTLGAPMTWSAANKSHKVAVTGVHGSVRVRCSVAVVGGTADAYFAAN